MGFGGFREQTLSQIVLLQYFLASFVDCTWLLLPRPGGLAKVLVWHLLVVRLVFRCWVMVKEVWAILVAPPSAS